MTVLPDHLQRLADDLDQAWQRAVAVQRRSPFLRRRRLVASVAGVALAAGGGAAIGAGVLKTPAQEERGILDGHVLFAGSDPVCASLAADAFRCTLERPPNGMTFYRPNAGRGSASAPKTFDPKAWTPDDDMFLGVKVATVDASKRIDGGCVSISADGRAWNCFLGERAVDEGIIGRDLLGAYQPEPAAG